MVLKSLKKRFSIDGRLEKAWLKREYLRDNAMFSVPEECGGLAIHVATATDRSDTPAERQKELFIGEGERLRDLHKSLGRYGAVYFYEMSDAMELTWSIQDPSIASIITIGHGNIGNFHLPNAKNYDWLKVSQATTHLKTGEIIQRTCGHIREDAKTIPWGVFALADQRRLFAAKGRPVPEQINEEDDALFEQLYKQRDNSLEELLFCVNSLRLPNDKYYQDDMKIDSPTTEVI